MNLFVLCADKNMEEALSCILKRASEFGCAPFGYEIFRHPEHDPGVRTKCVEFLRPFISTHHHVLVVLDYEGCGAEKLTPEKIEEDVELLLRRNGWKDRCACVVVKPELEEWLWSHDDVLAETLEWSGGYKSLRGSLKEAGIWPMKAQKPTRPKEAFEHALRLKKMPRSSSLYSTLASTMQLATCKDRALLKIRASVSQWYPAQ